MQPPFLAIFSRLGGWGRRLLRPFRILPATRAFIREARAAPGYGLLDFLHGYVYARWVYLYIGIGTGEHRAVRLFGFLVPLLKRLLRFRPPEDPANPAGGAITFADTYHGKVVPLAAARQLVTIQRPIRLTGLEHVIPYSLARDVVIHNPDHIVLLDCPCRSARPTPCLPLDVCLIVGEPFAGFVMAHYPRRARRVDVAEAVAVLKAEARRGHVHHAFFKEALFGRFYAICNCCACCCGAMQAMRNGVPMLASSGYLSRLEAERCVQCGLCAQRCPFGAITWEEGGYPAIDAAVCMGCGVCVNRCARKALGLVRDPAKPAPLELDHLLAEAERGADRRGAI
ncbi:MAG: 4Fe-4S binding protein [Desulfobacterales bacterium]|jgi:ferredoxin